MTAYRSAPATGPRAFIARVLMGGGVRGVSANPTRLLYEAFEVPWTWWRWLLHAPHCCIGCNRAIRPCDTGWEGPLVGTIFCAACGESRWHDERLRVPTPCVEAAQRLSWWTIHYACSCPRCVEQRRPFE